MVKLYICIAAYNEKGTIKNTLDYLENSLNIINFKEKPLIIICLNGCTDDTEQILDNIKNNYTYPLKIIKAKKGKLRAHKEIIKRIKGEGHVLFLDADVLLPATTLFDLLDCLRRNKKLKVVSAYPYVNKPNHLKGYKKIQYSILNIKRIYPKVEISKEDVSKFHGPDVQDKFLKRSRIYFHGRCFVIRNKNIYKFPKKGSAIRGDDTFLSFAVLKSQPNNSIKVLFNSPVYSYPIFSVIEYLKVWYRIRKDIDNICFEYPEFKELRKKTKMIMNWRYVLFDLPLNYKLCGIGFYFLKKFEALSYSLFKKRIDVDTIWSYNKKTEKEVR